MKHKTVITSDTGQVVKEREKFTAFTLMGQNICDVFRNKDKMLIVATSKGDTEKIKRALKKGADHEATIERQKFVIKKIPWNLTYKTPLEVAVENGQLQTMKILIEAGANVNSARQNTPLTLAMAQNNLDAVKLLIESGAGVDSRDTSRRTALMFAAQKGNQDAVRYLIDNGADVNAKDDTGPVLLYANAEITKILIEAGADVNAGDWRDQRTILIHAAYDRDVEKMRLLIAAGANVNAMSTSGETALSRAVSYHQDSPVEVVKLLIANGAGLEIRDKNGITALMYAGMNGQIDSVKLLIEAGADVNAKDSYGQTVIKVIREYAGMLFGDPREIIALLRQNGAE
ncbi:MAG: ankyrin repeat domain-containing protein [Candidatus Micrarchaeota archaeon]|nr:ankyrin repeat domain-containing protein [Candidatus Micrarchaeota archaeon]